MFSNKKVIKFYKSAFWIFENLSLSNDDKDCT